MNFLYQIVTETYILKFQVYLVLCTIVWCCKLHWW